MDSRSSSWAATPWRSGSSPASARLCCAAGCWFSSPSSPAPTRSTTSATICSTSPAPAAPTPTHSRAQRSSPPSSGPWAGGSSPSCWWRSRCAAFSSPRPCPSSAARAHPVFEEISKRRELLEVGILLPLALDAGDGHVAVVVAGIETRLRWKLRDPLQALEHLLRISALQIAAAAGADEDGVAREERIAGLVAGGPRRVTRRVEGADGQRTNFDCIAGVQRSHLALHF